MKIVIKGDEHGSNTKVWLDGKLQPNVTYVAVDLEANEFTRVTIGIIPETLEIEVVPLEGATTIDKGDD